MSDVRSSPFARLFACGTPEPAAIPRRLEAGPLAVDIEDGAVRAVRWHGVEIVRGVNCLVRDRHWGTWPAENAVDSFDQRDGSFRYERRFAVAEGRVRGLFTAEGSAEGLVVAAELTAAAAIETNRAGLTLLHPIAGVAGTPLTIRHSDGSREASRFPELIQPSQPAFDIVGLDHDVDGVAVAIDFAGEIFEMEDQRNWSDASFKTYCRPLSLPTPYALEAGSVTTQRVTIRASGQPAAADGAKAQSLRFGDASGTMPEIVLALDAEAPFDEAAVPLVAAAGLDRIAVRLPAAIAAADLARLQPLLAGRMVEIEAIIADGANPAAALAALKATLDAAGIRPERLLALPAAYLASHQPSGPWPSGATPAEAARAARVAFPDAAIGGGMLTSFTEFNRCRPDADLVDYISHGTTAIVHAADDRSVMETLEALPAIFTSAAALAPDKPYRLGLTAIGMRSNAYGPERAADAEGRRLAMAKVDPRQRGLFAAAFAVGVAAATLGSEVESLALAMPTGPFGFVHAPADWPQPWYDTHDVRLYPLFHVVAALAEMSGKPRQTVVGLQQGLAAVAAGGTAIIANLTPKPASVPLAAPAGARVLDETSFAAAAADPHWRHGPVTPLDQLALGPYAVAFLTFDGDLT